MMKFKKLKKISKLSTFLFLVAILFVFAMFQGGFVSWFLFFSFLPFAIYSFMILLYPLRDIKVSRTLDKEKYRARDRLIGTITINRILPFPVSYLLVEEIMPSDLVFCQQSTQAKKIFFPWFKRSFTFQYALERIPRGEHTFTTVRVKCGDFFGLVEKERIIRVKNSFLVYPHYEEMVYKQNENKFDQGSTSSKMKLIRDTSMTVGVREYQPGDRFSWIDWKATARRNDIMTKEFEQQQSHDVLIILDRSQQSSFESAVSVTAALTKAVLKYGSQVGLVSIGKDRSNFSMRSGEEHFAEMYYHLARVQPNNLSSFGNTVEMEIGKVSPHVTFIFVTGKLEKDTVQTIEKLTYRNMNLQLYLTKDDGKKISKEELTLMESLKRRNVDVRTISKGHYTSMFSEVS
ncbi:MULTISPECIES: DUF58 domain-containing protein [Bacillus]|uniref:DUF58 domain-containing protein n=1 Tax=Bacillus TaxID=1386 RepID=UPI001D0D48E3|nr:MULTISPECIES: DUF58 domain-containing protein [Bacillus]